MPEIKEIEQICSIEELNVTPNTDTTCVTEMKPMKHGKNVSSSSDSIKRANLMKAFLHAIKYNHVFLGIFTYWNKSYKKIDRVLIYHA